MRSFKASTSWRLCLTALVTLGEFAHLAWEHVHGGIHRHHILNRDDLPAISNGWGMLLIPVLTWFLSGLAQVRMMPSAPHSPGTSRFARTPVLAFGGALLTGVLLAALFTGGHEDATAWLFQGLLLLALIFPLYRAEYLLGFVLGMTFTFGAILPTAAGCVIAALSAVARLLLLPLLLRAWAWLKSRR